MSQLLLRRRFAILGFLAASACGGPDADTRLELVRHFAGGADAPSPIATIGDETRPVLRAFPSATLVSGRDLDTAGRTVVREPLPLELSSARRLAIIPYAVRGKQWQRLPTLVAPVQSRGGKRVVEIAIDPGGSLGVGAGAKLNAYARAPIEGRRDTHETPAFEVPRRAVLDFGLGILPLAWNEGPVRFAVSSCLEGTCSQLFAEELDPRRPRARRWRDRRLPLAHLAGKRVSLLFEADFLGPGQGFTFPVWSNPWVGAPAPREVEPAPNLILFSLDTLRADHLSSYGYERDTAPRLHALLAQRGALVVDCIAPAPSTAPSHMTMFTALPPSVHSVRENVGAGALPHGATTLAEVLRARGFATGAVTENAAISGPRGFARGFDTYLEMKSEGSPRAAGAIERTLARARRWLEQNRDRRFFLFVHSYQVHAPHAAPPPFDAEFPLAAERRSAPPDPQHDPLEYDREIRYSDEVIGRFLEALEGDGLLDSTIFVFTSDHGEEFFEHGFVEHGAQLHEEVLRVPLIAMGPGIPAGHRVDVPVGLTDLMPTLLDLLGVPDPDQGLGRSFAPLLHGEAPDAAWKERPVFSEAWAPFGMTPQGRVAVEQPTFAVRLGRRKLVRRREAGAFHFSYFDLDADADESDARSGEGPDAADLRERLSAYEREAEKLRIRLERDGAPPAPAEDVLGPERLERLRALGYID